MGIKIHSTYQVKKAEEIAILSGVSEEQLIDRASDKIVQFLRDKNFKDIAFLCGGGNNGSDALLSAIKIGKGIKVFVGGKPNEINLSFRKRLEQITTILPLSAFDGNCEVIIDGLCGTGLSRKLDGEYEYAVKVANESNAYKVALDIPSGLDDIGNIVGSTAFRADTTLALGGVKYADIMNDALDYCNEVIFCDIGLRFDNSGATLIGKEDVEIEQRKRNTHKGNYGKIKIVGGSKNFVGAPCFSAMSAIRSGAGLTCLCVPQSLQNAYLDSKALFGYTFEFMTDIDGQHEFDTKCAQRISQNADVIAIGMGMGSNTATLSYIEYFAQNFDGTLIIDADGITAISKSQDFFRKKRKAKIILTPHVGEFLRLNPTWDKSAEEVRDFAKRNNVSIVVKSATSIISDGEEIAINNSGNSALAKGGSGDVLVGIIASMVATYSPFDALKRACYYLGASAEKYCETHSPLSLIPQDLIETLKLVLK